MPVDPGDPPNVLEFGCCVNHHMRMDTHKTVFVAMRANVEKDKWFMYECHVEDIPTHSQFQRKEECIKKVY